MAHLAVSSRMTATGPLIVAVGEIEPATVERFSDAVVDAINNVDDAMVTINLSRVDFIDSAGLGVLVEASKRLRGNSRQLRVVLTNDSQPDRVVRLGRFDTIMAVAYGSDDSDDFGEDGGVREPRWPTSPDLAGSAAREVPHDDDRDMTR